MNKIIAHRYKIIEEIASPWLATIYKALDQKNNCLVRIRVLKERINNIPFPLQLRFKKEVEAFSKISLSNLLKIYAL